MIDHPDVGTDTRVAPERTNLIQNGMGWLPLLWIVVTLLVCLLFVAQMYPVYYDHYRINNSFNVMVGQPDSLSSGKKHAVRQLSKIMTLDDVGDVIDDDQALTLKRGKDGIKSVEFKYQRTVPIIYNLSILVHFQMHHLVGSE